MSNAPGTYTPGISAVSPPSSVQPAASHASAMPRDDLGDEVGVERAGGDVVEEEQRPGRLHEHVVDAVVDDVDADAADLAEAGGQLDLRADAVGRRDEHRVVHRQRSPWPRRRRRSCRRRARPRRRGCARRRAFIWATARLPSSMSTPAAAYDAQRRRRAPASRCRGAPASRRSGSSAMPRVRGVAGRGEVVAEPGDGEHPPAGRHARRPARPGTGCVRRSWALGGHDASGSGRRAGARRVAGGGGDDGAGGAGLDRERAPRRASPCVRGERQRRRGRLRAAAARPAPRGRRSGRCTRRAAGRRRSASARRRARRRTACRRRRGGRGPAARTSPAARRPSYGTGAGA